MQPVVRRLPAPGAAAPTPQRSCAGLALARFLLFCEGMTSYSKHSAGIAASFFAFSLLFAGCGGEVAPGDPTGNQDGTEPGVVQEDSTHLKWWNSHITSQRWEHNGWEDTDLGVASSTAVQLRHASKLIDHGVYAWGYMPTFVDTVTGKKFRFLHLRPQHQWATQVGHVYPAHHVVGLSGGDTRDTGYPVYSTGPHLCVHTVQPFRTVFPAGN